LNQLSKKKKALKANTKMKRLSKNIYSLIQKNLKLLIRSKSSALIIILAPLMLILLIGISYSASQTGLNIGVHAPSSTEEIDSFLNSLQEEDYKIVTYNTSEECIEDIKQGFIHTCLSLPENFHVQDNSPKEITFYIDQSKINLVYMITGTLTKKFNLKSKEISQELTSNLLTKLSSAKSKIEEKSPQIDNVKNKNSQAIARVESINTDLTSIDFAVPLQDIIYDDSVFTDFKGNASSKISTAISSLASAKSVVSSSSLNSSEKSSINSHINNANDKIDQLSSLINNSGEGSIAEISSSISSLISTLQSDINLTKTKLNTASNRVSSAETQFTSVTTILNEGIASLDSLKTILSEIQADLASQKITEASTIAAPLTTKIEKITVEKNYLDYVFPSLIILVIMFISILLGTTLVMMEKHNPAYFRNFIAPVRKITFIFSTYLTNSFLVLIQIAIILSISLIFLKEGLAQLPLIALVLFVSSSVFTLIGMLVGHLFVSEDTGTLASISTSSLLLFISGIILPLENMSSSIRQTVYFNPFVISEKLIREIFIFNYTFSNIFKDLLLLVGYVVILFIIILIIDSIASKHFLTKILYKHHKHLREEKTKKLKTPT